MAAAFSPTSTQTPLADSGHFLSFFWFCPTLYVNIPTIKRFIHRSHCTTQDLKDMISTVTSGILFRLRRIQSLVNLCFSWAAWLSIQIITMPSIPRQDQPHCICTSQMAFRTIYLSGKLAETTGQLVHGKSHISGRVICTGDLFSCTKPNVPQTHCPS